MAKRRRARRKKPLKFAIILVLSLIVIFAVTFLIFFRLLGGSFREENETETVTVTQSPASVSATAQVTVTAPPTERPTQRTVTAAPTTAPAATATPAAPEQGDPVELRGGEYAYPTHKTVITKEELQKLTRGEIKVIFNEIYARHGMTFNDEELVDYFEMQQWYVPTTTDSKTAESRFTSTEWENYRIIFDYQKEMGWRS